MKKNILFLILGLLSTILTKFLQFYTINKLGDVIVLFSGFFFVCSILFSNSRFNELYQNDNKKGTKLIIHSSLIVILFQVMMILVVNGILIGLVIILPLLILIKLIYPKIIYLIK